MPFRFIHTADLHLDSPLRSLVLRDPELAELIGNATRQTFARIIDLCLEERVDALLIAGDLYDGAQTSMKTARFLAREMGRLHEAGIRACMIRGNHDALSKITKELSFPEGTVTVFGARASTVALGGANLPFEVVVHGLSFAKPTAPESLLPRFLAPALGAVNIGLLHTSLGGAAGHDVYAPCTSSDLAHHGFAYWALGHVHKRSVAHEEATTIVMPGMPQGRDIGESGAKSVELVTIADDRSIRLERRYPALAEFARVPVSLARANTWEEARAAIAHALEAARADVRAEHLVARLELDGETPLAARLRRDQDLLLEEARDCAFSLGKTWIEGVTVACRNRGAAAPGPLAELARLIAGEVIPSAAFKSEAAEIARQLTAKLPQECRDALGTDEASTAAILDELGQKGSEEVLAELAGGAGPDECA